MAESGSNKHEPRRSGVLLSAACPIRTMSFGVAAGASTPYQVLISKSRMPDSATAGNSGAAGSPIAEAIDLTARAATR